VPVHLAGRHRARRAIALRPLHHRGHRNPEPSGSSRRPPLPRPLAHADRWKEVGSSDAGLQSSQHLESQTISRGNPFRFSQSVNRSSSPLKNSLAIAGGG
jgi:hypothetical protein